MAHEKIVTMFSTLAQAEGAKRSLIKAGFVDHDIDVISGERLQSEGHEARHPGFWQRLFGSTLDEEQSSVYEDAIKSGSVVMTLRAEEDKLPRAYSIIDAHDQGELSAGRGLTQGDEYTPPSTHTADEVTGLHKNLLNQPVRTSLNGDESEEEVLRLAEERLDIGKRLVSEGSTRVRRYTVTDQVSANVSLHEQHAEIFRRPIDNLVSTDDVDWEEKTIEVAETHEQPVINKKAHIKEEVVVRKDQSEHVEKVTDSVRRQELDIDHTGSDLTNGVSLSGDMEGKSAVSINATDADARVGEKNGAADVHKEEKIDPLLKRP